MKKRFTLSLAALLVWTAALAADAPPAAPVPADAELEYDFVQLVAIDLKGMRIQLELDLEENDPGRLVWIRLDPNADVSDGSRRFLELEDLRAGDQVSVACEKADGEPLAIEIVDYSRQAQD